MPRLFTALGRRAVAHCTSLGKVLLAHRPWEEVTRTIERYGWRPYTERSIQSIERLRRELAAVREQGYAIDEEERRAGVVCLAAPVRNRAGEVIAALSVSGTAEKLHPAAREAILPRVREAADRVAFGLGYAATAAYL